MRRYFLSSGYSVSFSPYCARAILWYTILHVQSKIQCLSIIAFNTVLNVECWIWVSIPCVICIQFWHNFFTTNQLFLSFTFDSSRYHLELYVRSKWDEGTSVRNRINSFLIAAAPHLHVNQCSEQQIQFTYSKQSLEHAYDISLADYLVVTYIANQLTHA